MASGRLHRDGGPVLAYPDGFALWRLNGVAVPDWLAAQPADAIDPRRLPAIPNAEVRREFIRKVGLGRVLPALGARVISSSGRYELLELDLGDGRAGPISRCRTPAWTPCTSRASTRSAGRCRRRQLPQRAGAGGHRRRGRRGLVSAGRRDPATPGRHAIQVCAPRSLPEGRTAMARSRKAKRLSHTRLAEGEATGHVPFGRRARCRALSDGPGYVLPVGPLGCRSDAPGTSDGDASSRRIRPADRAGI